MERIIKFRAWDKKHKEMINNPHLKNWAILQGCDIDDWIPMQYTGLKDKNEKEIYEGDIVKDNQGNIDEVVFSQGAFGITDVDYVDPEVNMDITDRHFIEIIGNIYENPELLKSPATAKQEVG